MANEPVKNDAGQVAMKYPRKSRVLVRCGGNQYVFHTRANICMTWVDEADVPCVLAVRGGCCGNRKPGVVRYANESDVRRWTNGGGR